MAYEGQCDKCKSVTCPNYGICIDDGYTYKCTCPETCTEVISNSYIELNVTNSRPFDLDFVRKKISDLI